MGNIEVIDVEKPSYAEVEQTRASSPSSGSQKSGPIDDLRDPDEGKTDEERAELDRQLLRKLDWRYVGNTERFVQSGCID